MSDYPPVRVTGALGYADFDGWLLLASGPDWPVNRSVVGFEREGKRDVAVVPSDCVTPLPDPDDDDDDDTPPADCPAPFDHSRPGHYCNMVGDMP